MLCCWLAKVAYSVDSVLLLRLMGIDLCVSVRPRNESRKLGACIIIRLYCDVCCFGSRCLWYGWLEYCISDGYGRALYLSILCTHGLHRLFNVLRVLRHITQLQMMCDVQGSTLL